MSTAKPALIKYRKSLNRALLPTKMSTCKNGEKKLPRKTWLQVRIGIMNVRASIKI